MNRFNSIFFFLIIIFFPFWFIQAQSCYELVWNDEFNYEGLPDSNKWSHEIGGTGWGNNELQYYTDKREENTRVENGVLVIEARKEDYKGSSYTSARLITYPVGHSWKYGKIEARIKLPYGQGIWPAFWMLGDGIFEGTAWPASGEIDIIEMIGGGEGRDDMLHGTIHWEDASGNHSYKGGHTQLSEGIFADTFHVFSIEWTAEKIDWFLDGVNYHTEIITPDALSEFHENFFILLNLAVGGDWPGYPDASTVFPQKMYVDYVRVYQLNNQAKIDGDLEVVKGEKEVKLSTVESDELTYLWTVPDDAVITEGQGTSSIRVNWGCTFDTVTCQIAGLCNTYTSKVLIIEKDFEVYGDDAVAENSPNLTYSTANTITGSYNWYTPEGVIFTSPEDSNSVSLNWNDQSGTLKVVVQNICGSDSAEKSVSVVKTGPYPDSDMPNSIPGIIESIHYDQGGEGFSYSDFDLENNGTGSRQSDGVDTEPNDGGENVGWIEADEWLKYTIDVSLDDLYDIDIRTASINSTGKFKILFNGADKTGEIAVPNTTSWNSFTTISIDRIPLSTTDTLMTIYMVSGGFNLGRLTFEQSSTSSNNTVSINKFEVYPTLVDKYLFVRNVDNQPYSIIDFTGSIVKKGMSDSSDPIDVGELLPGVYFISFHNRKADLPACKFIKVQ